MKIFPAIDIKDKKCVRLVKGDFDNITEYEVSPLEQACSRGDTSYSVILSKSPLTNLTHFLSFISIAGNIFIY